MAKDTAKLKRERAAINAAALDAVTMRLGGDRSKLGRALGISRATPSTWSEVPQKYVRRLSELTGLPPEQILPDPYPYH